MMVDTLTIARELKAADLPEGQAEAIATAIGRSVAESSATKADLELTKHELRSEIEHVRTDIERVRTELERTRSQLLTWIMSALVALAGLIIAVVKL